MRLFHRAFLQEKETVVSEKSIISRIGRTVGNFLLLTGLSAATVCLFTFSYPKFSYSLLAWLALIPFTWAIFYLRGFWATFFFSWLTGTAVYAALYNWVFITCLEGGEMGWGLSMAAWLGLSLLMGIQFALFGSSCYYFKRLRGFFPVVAAMGFVALEWFHETLAFYVLGFPWFSLAYSQWNMPAVLQIASFTGAAGVSFAVAFVGLCLGYSFVPASFGKSVRYMVVAAVVFLSVYGLGLLYLKHLPTNNLLRLHAAIMQPNIDQYKKWSLEFEDEIREVLATMNAQLVGQNVMLTVWPENVTPGPVEEEPYYTWIAQAAKESKSFELVGTNRDEQDKQYVSAFLFNPQGEPVGIYDKVHLVPFGEMIPFEKTVRRLFPNVAVLGELGFFSAGKWPQPLLQLDKISFGSTICYESVFSRLWREQARAGARMLVNITNDAWFFDTSAPYQHLAISVLRAVENRRTVLRAANTGISAVISPAGEIVSRAELNTRAILEADVALPLSPDISFYTKWGNWFAWLCVLVYVTIFISAFVFMYE